MAITHIDGTDGAITFASGYVGCPTAWTINFAAEDVETTCLGDSWKTRVAGIKEWGGTFTVRLDSSLTTWGTAPNDQGLGFQGASAPAVFTAGQNTVTGNIIITGADVTLAIGGASGEVTFTFVGDGVATTGPTLA